MKATLEFKLPEEQAEFNRANKSLDMAIALFEILQLRNNLESKFQDQPFGCVTEMYVIECMFNLIADTLDKYDIDTYKLIQ
jgi:hypothetical protein